MDPPSRRARQSSEWPRHAYPPNASLWPQGRPRQISRIRSWVYNTRGIYVCDCEVELYLRVETYLHNGHRIAVYWTDVLLVLNLSDVVQNL